MNETGYAFNLNKGKANERAPVTTIAVSHNKTLFKLYRVCGHVSCTRLQGALHLRLNRKISFDGKLLPVDIRHSLRSSSRLSRSSSLRSRRRNFLVSNSLTRAPATTPRRACIGGMRVKGYVFNVIQNHVPFGFLPRVLWANLSLLESFDTVFWSDVLCSVLRRYCVAHSKRRLLVALPGSALCATRVDHHIWGVLRAVLHRFRTYIFERRLLAGAFDPELVSAHDDDHPVRCMLRTILQTFFTCHSEQHLLAAAFGSPLAVHDVDHPFRGMPHTINRRFYTCHSK